MLVLLGTDTCSRTGQTPLLVLTILDAVTQYLNYGWFWIQQSWHLMGPREDNAGLDGF